MKKYLLLAGALFASQAYSAPSYVVDLKLITPKRTTSDRIDSNAPYYSKEGQTRNYVELVCEGNKKILRSTPVFDGTTIDGLSKENELSIIIESSTVIDKSEEIGKISKSQCITIRPDIKTNKLTAKIPLTATAESKKIDLGDGYSIQYEVHQKH
jgi:hypothetical protein